MFFGGVIGFDREQTSKPAGLRTHMLVAAAALLVGVSGVILEQGDAGKIDSKEMSPQTASSSRALAAPVPVRTM